MDSEASNTTITESKTPEKTDLVEAVPTSIETEAKVSPERQNKVAEPDTYSSRSASTSTYTDTAKAPLPGNTKPVSTENGSDKREDSDEEDDGDDDGDDVDSDDDFPEFEGGEPRGRIVSPVAGPKPRPIRPNN